MAPHRRSFHEAGHAHELTCSCYHSYPFLKTDRTCEWLAESLDDARRELKFQIWCYVFIPNHFHVIVFPHPDHTSLGEILKAIKAPVARRAIAYLEEAAPECLPRITRVRGNKTERLFWQSGGGYDRNVTDPQTFHAMLAYIHANPVRKRFVQRPRDWQWSSAAWYDDLTEGPLRLDPIPGDWLE